MITIQEMLISSIKDLIQNSTSDKKINELYDTHKNKVHFIPFKYRVIGGILQSMNIQFGNFIEEVVEATIMNDSNNYLIKDYSGKKRNIFKLSQNSDNLIDNYITNCQVNNYSEEQLKQNYDQLINNITINEKNDNLDLNSFNHDIDVLFKDKRTDTIYYVEIKYNDDHDTGKFVDINRKLLKTYAYLIREFKNIKVKPILLYFNNKKMKGNIYLPETSVIYRGKRFFEEFTDTKYEDLDKYMAQISEDKQTIKIFDDLMNNILFKD